MGYCQDKGMFTRWAIKISVQIAHGIGRGICAQKTQCEQTLKGCQKNNPGLLTWQSNPGIHSAPGHTSV